MEKEGTAVIAFSSTQTLKGWNYANKSYITFETSDVLNYTLNETLLLPKLLYGNETSKVVENVDCIYRRLLPK